MALGVYGFERFTNDVALLVDGSRTSELEDILKSVGFSLFHRSNDILQFDGIGHLDILLAHRPVSQKMLSEAPFIKDLGIKCLRAEDIIGLKIQAYCNDPRRRFKDLADIQQLLTNKNLDLNQIKSYADHFNEWKTVEELISK